MGVPGIVTETKWSLGLSFAFTNAFLTISSFVSVSKVVPDFEMETTNVRLRLTAFNTAIASSGSTLEMKNSPSRY